MTIPLSEIETDFTLKNATNSKIGPGKYLSQSHYNPEPSLSPFKSTKIRDTEEIIPIPQAYLNPGIISYIF